MSKKDRPPHPATVPVERPPHPATVQRKETPFGAPRVPPPHPATVQREKTPAGMPAARPSSPRPGVVQRTVLYDVDTDAREREMTLGLFPGARAFVEEFEIYQSAERLAELAHTGVDKHGRPLRFPIRKPEPERLKKTEPLILVGHGGGGQFMNMKPDELESYLISWGVEKGMQVVLAGCQTAEAQDAIEVIKRLTGKEPVVNKELAYTGPLFGKGLIGEFLVNDRDSALLYKARNDELKKVDHFYVEGHAKALSGIIDDISINTYHDALKLVLKFCELTKQKKPNVNDKPIPKNVSTLGQHWQQTIKQLLGGGSIQVGMLVEALNQFQQFLASKETKPIKLYKDVHAELLTRARKEAKAINDEFIEKLKQKVPFKPIDYSLEAAKVGGPLPVVVRIHHDLKALPGFTAPTSQGNQSIADLVMSFLPSTQSLNQSLKKQ